MAENSRRKGIDLAALDALNNDERVSKLSAARDENGNLIVHIVKHGILEEVKINNSSGTDVKEETES